MIKVGKKRKEIRLNLLDYKNIDCVSHFVSFNFCTTWPFTFVLFGKLNGIKLETKKGKKINHRRRTNGIDTGSSNT